MLSVLLSAARREDREMQGVVEVAPPLDPVFAALKAIFEFMTVIAWANQRT
jgi:hypothetical protein